ncbi:hypothetical protein LCGC14_0692120 [marine sediment metagenome]|uniref:Uncharacterized protein n=1 Tax=marine sediment metagenome TaxID=412755 RepID=A0A0F9R5G7_9ZZZZ
MNKITILIASGYAITWGTFRIIELDQWAGMIPITIGIWMMIWGIFTKRLSWIDPFKSPEVK